MSAIVPPFGTAAGTLDLSQFMPEAILSGVRSKVKESIQSHLQLARDDIMALLERQRQEAFMSPDTSVKRLKTYHKKKGGQK